jgi:DNA ligase (NAD+)
MRKSMTQSIEKRIQNLRDELNHHNYLYYVEAQPTVSDREYDKLMRELTELEAAHPEFASADSPTQRVGGEPIESFRTVDHAVAMMSIDNTYDEAEVREFDARVKKNLGGEQPAYVVEPKVDGVSGSLRYEKGLLVLAATRGDGRRGDDITAQVRTIQSIPLRLHDTGGIPAVLEIRGEIYMPNDVFQRINKQREAAGEELYKNPRNLTTGTLKQLDPKITASRKLSFVCHGFGQVEPLPVEGYWEFVKLLKTWRLPVPQHTKFVKDIDHVIAAIEAFADVRGKLPYQTDGMVVKVDSLSQRTRLGVTSKAPRWVIAFKYAAEQMQTVLKEVDWQVGKTDETGSQLVAFARR